MSLVKAEPNVDRVYGRLDYLFPEHRDTPERFWELDRFGLQFVLDGDPLIAGSHNHGISQAPTCDNSPQVLVRLHQTTSHTANVIYHSFAQKGNNSSARKNEHELRAQATAAEIYRQSQTNDDIELLRYCFGVIEAAFSKADLEFVDCPLDTLDTSKIQVIGSLGIARATGRARKWLPMWGVYVARLRDHLVAQGEVVSQSMRGLINTNDQFTFIARRVAL